METAILAVACIGSIFLAAWWLRREVFKQIDSFIPVFRRISAEIDAGTSQSASILNLLAEASKRNALREKPSTFDKADDKIPASSARYIPVARRRAQAERASAGPQNHTDQVRANNAKVMETL